MSVTAIDGPVRSGRPRLCEEHGSRRQRQRVSSGMDTNPPALLLSASHMARHRMLERHSQAYSGIPMSLFPATRLTQAPRASAAATIGRRVRFPLAAVSVSDCQPLLAVDYLLGRQLHPLKGVMAQPYLDRLAAKFGECNPSTPRGVSVECKHFFSGAALYANGKIFASLSPAGFAVKLPEKLRNTLLRERRGRPLCYFKGGPIKNDYVVVSRTVVADTEVLRELLRTAIRSVSQNRVNRSQ